MNTRLKILNIWVDPVDKEQAVARVRIFLKQGDRPHSIFASNPEKNFSIPKDPILFEAFKEADLLLPDGIGMVMAARILYGVRLTRVPGSEFIYNICGLAADEGHSIFVYGAGEEINATAVNNFKMQYPALEIAGRSNGYVGESEMPYLIDRINESRAKILFLGLGSPKQEKWFAAHKHQLQHVRVCQGVGGTLDTIAGHVKRAPALWCRYHLEWLYRLLSEPRRIKRQKVLPLFAAMVILTWVKKKLNG